MKQTPNKTEDSCLFCRKEITKKSFCNTVLFSAFYNIAPILPGHSLIIPKKHYESLFELPEDELGEMMVFARKITSVLKIVFKCDGFDWTIQDGVSAGQTVPHLHLHIIPRKLLDLAYGEEWYGKVRENEKNLLDSQQRKRLNDKDYNNLSSLLSAACKKSEIQMKLP